MTPDVAALTSEARALAAKPDCPQHEGFDAARCGACASERLAAGDHAGAKYLAALRAMLACDRLFPARYRDALPSHPDVAAWVARVVDNPADAPSLLLLGPVGVGKTWQAYGALRTVVAALPGLGWATTSFADFTAALRPRPGVDSEAEMERFRDAGLLLVDDLGAAKSSEWVEEITYRLANARYEAMRPTIYATNFGGGELRGTLGDRIASRLAETCVRVVLDGPDRRRTTTSPP